MLGPVHDGVYTGWDYEYCGGDAFVPSVWRRWPIDLIAMPNEVRIEGQKVRAAPPDLAQRLYEGVTVVKDGVRPPAPFTRRGVLYALNAALYRLPLAPDEVPKLIGKLREAHCIDGIRTWLETQRGDFVQRVAEQETTPDLHAVSAEREIVRLDTLLSFLVSHPTPAALIAYFQDAQARLCAWQADCRTRLQRLREAWREGDLDSKVTEADWARLQAEAAEERL